MREELSQPVSENQSIVILIASIAALSGILLGYETGVISGAILYIDDEFVLSPWLNHFVVNSILFGAFLGCLIGGSLADYWGRRVLLIMAALIFLIGTVESTLAASSFSLILSRAILGIGIGIASFTAPLYIAEIAPAKSRGMLVSLNQLAITIGIVAAYILDAHYAKHGGQWRWMFGVGIVPAIVLLIGMLCLPNSPEWLKAREKKGAKWSELFQPWGRSALFIGVGLAFFQQCTGINVIIYFAPTVFEIAGFQSHTVAILATFGIGILNIVVTLLFLSLIDRWGRRPLLLMGLIGMTLGLVSLSVAFYLGVHTSGLKWLAFVGMMTYIVSFAMSLGPIVWLMIVEIFSRDMRGLGAGLAASSCWGLNIIVTLLFLPLIQLLGSSGTFFIYAVLCMLGTVFVAAYVPETCGTPLPK